MVSRLAVVAAGRVGDERVVGCESASERRRRRRRLVIAVQVVLGWGQLTQTDVPAPDTVLYHAVVQERHVRVHTFLPVQICRAVAYRTASM